MPELIYNIENIFSKDNKESCLNEYDVTQYFIGAYQRGYKWDSDKNGAVTVLLKDIYSAYMECKNNKKKEYFLQYITLKRNAGEKYFEVIDGQQRLTTLSLLLSIFAARLNVDNISKDRIFYEIRDNFLVDYIYNLANLQNFISAQWDGCRGLQIENFEAVNSQDVYYLHKAAQKIDNFLQKDVKETELEDFYSFLLKNVKIIVNVVSHVSSEKVFSNMNSNKVALTESELIKALLLTRYSRFGDTENNSPRFKEILDLRLTLGRQWDEICRWCNIPEVNNFYFSGKDGMNSVLQLVAEIKGYKSVRANNESNLPLFNFYHSNIQPSEAYELLIKVYSILKDWYNDVEVYNLLGYLFFAKGSSRKVIEFLLPVYAGSIRTRSSLLETLANDAKKLLPDNPALLLYDSEHDKEIHCVLLALNIFQPGDTSCYDFYQHKKESWTLEHIFPQTPEGKGQVLEEKDKKLIEEMLDDVMTPEIHDVLSFPKRDDKQKEIYQAPLKSSKTLNSIGNLCLLKNEDNISNGCSFFDVKRTNVLQRIRAGSFVPKHTFEVFSKMIFDTTPGDPDRWTLINIKNHAEIISDRLSKIEWYKL